MNLLQSEIGEIRFSLDFLWNAAPNQRPSTSLSGASAPAQDEAGGAGILPSFQPSPPSGNLGRPRHAPPRVFRDRMACQRG